MLKRFPIGLERFEEVIRDGFCFVDKTMYIKDLLQQRGAVNLFTRPRRFGKTLTMSMLKNFFEIGNDPSLFDGLAISREKEICEQYMGKYPVISISLKTVEGLTYEEALGSMKTVIGDEAGRFDFLETSERLSDIEKNAYHQIYKNEIDGKTKYSIENAILEDSLKTLTSLLSKHYGKDVIVLIDEYDVPLNKAYENGYYDQMVNLIRKMFNAGLKTNDHLYFGVLTGCLRISKESIFTGFNNLKVYSLSDPRFDSFFGFTEKEVDELLSYYDLSECRDKFRDWYDGYLFGNTHIYCPWDVLNYCDLLVNDATKEPENYWANSSGNELVTLLLREADDTTRMEMESLINEETIYKEIREELTYRDIHNSVDNVWSVLYSTGYLTKTGRQNEDGIELRLPNKEICSLIVSLIKEWFTDVTSKDKVRIAKFYDAFVSGETPVIEEMMNDYLWESISIRDTAVVKSRKESFYHGMLLGLLKSRGLGSVKSNAESGEGFSDISIQLRNRKGIVIEIKYAEDGNLEKACDAAIRQIKEKHYADGMKDSGVKEVLAYGMAFYKKQCKVKLVV